jgi:hypothetical protein
VKQVGNQTVSNDLGFAKIQSIKVFPGIIAVFENQELLVDSLAEAQRTGFDMRKISVVGKDNSEEETQGGLFSFMNRSQYWESRTNFWNRICARLLGSALIVIPGIGPVVVAGPFTETFIIAIESTLVASGKNAVGLALSHLGIDRQTSLEYEAAVQSGRFLLIIDRVGNEETKAWEFVTESGAQQIEEFRIRS